MNTGNECGVQKESEKDIENIATTTIDAAYNVYFNLGPGLLESVYESCLIHELKKKGLLVESQVRLPIFYDGICINEGFRLDLLIENCLIVEIKTVEAILPVHKAQLLTNLKLSGKTLGLLLNFNSAIFKEGIKKGYQL